MRNAEQVVEQEYLVVRSKILEIAAFFDRLEDEQNLGATSENRLKLIREGCQILLDEGADKAARVQLLFSRQFDPQWRSTMQV